MNYYMFNDKKEAELIEVGGKAKSLMTLTKGGFNVPTGAVLTVEFFLVIGLKSLLMTLSLKACGMNHQHLRNLAIN